MLKKKFCRDFRGKCLWHADCEPKYYVNVKGKARLLSVRHTDLELTMAVENGITLLLGIADDSPNV